MLKRHKLKAGLRQNGHPFDLAYNCVMLDVLLCKNELKGCKKKVLIDPVTLSCYEAGGLVK